MSDAEDEILDTAPGEDDLPEAAASARRRQDGHPDVLLDVPQLHVDEISLEVQDLRARVSLQASVLELLNLHVGVDAVLGRVQLTIKGVEAQVLLKAHLDNVARILDRVLTTIDTNPQIVERLAEQVGGAVERVGTGAGYAFRDLGASAGSAVEELGDTGRTAVGDVGRGAAGAVEDAAHGVATAVEGLGAEAPAPRPADRDTEAEARPRRRTEREAKARPRHRRSTESTEDRSRETSASGPETS